MQPRVKSSNPTSANDPGIYDNLSNHTFFHGTDSLNDVASIKQRGFELQVYDKEDGTRYKRDGLLGVGVYVTCDWKVAFWYGRILLQVTVKPGTRILDATPPPDKKVLASLKGEFGKEILTGTDVRKSIPANKQLRLHELIALVRHFYNLAWQDVNFDRNRWPKWRAHADKSLMSCARMLKRFKIDGFGDPVSDMGIVIFNPDKVVVQKIVAKIPENDFFERFDFGHRLDGMTLERLGKEFGTNSKTD